VLGLDLDREVADRSDLPQGAAALIEERDRARTAKDWATADRLRRELAAMGITVIDTPTGTHWTIQREH
jgi:cysteinyl-tRNA synthetase